MRLIVPKKDWRLTVSTVPATTSASDVGGVERQNVRRAPKRDKARCRAQPEHWPHHGGTVSR
jgi:hypothetical protein